MAAEKDDSLQAISVRLDGKNFAYWNYVMKNFLKGKKMWGYVNGSNTKPTDEKAENSSELIDVWEANNSKIITWINNSVVPSIGIQLAKFEYAKEVWDHLTKLFSQSNFAKRYQLECDIHALEQNKMSVHEFYSAMTDLWDQLTLMESNELRAFAPYIASREEQRLVQFLMALRDDFEGLRGSILHRNPLPSVDSVVHELLAEEVRLKTQFGKEILTDTNPSVLAASFQVPSSNKSKSYTRVGNDACSYCKEKGHWKAQCPKLGRSNYNGRPSHQKQSHSNWKFDNQSQQQANQLQQHSYKSPMTYTAAVVPSSDSCTHESISSSTSPMTSLAEQFQKFLTTQPHAMSMRSTVSDADWDRP